MRLSVVQQIAGVLCFALVALVVGANLGCAPKYFQRGDVIALLALGLFDGVLLLGASSGDSDTHRVVGVAASASAATLFLATVSIPVRASSATGTPGAIIVSIASIPACRAS